MGLMQDRVYYEKRFYNSFPDKKYVQKFHQTLPKYLSYIEKKRNGEYSGKDDLKSMKGFSGIYKYWLDGNFRVFFKMEHCVSGKEPIQGVFFLACRSHNEQDAAGKRDFADWNNDFTKLGADTCPEIASVDRDELKNIDMADNLFLGPTYMRTRRELEYLEEFLEQGNYTDAQRSRFYVDDMRCVLDPMQTEAVGSKKYSIVYGGAGSGKSLVGLKWLQDFRDGQNVLYMTMSESLCEVMAEKQKMHDAFRQFCIRKESKEPLRSWGTVAFFTPHQRFVEYVGNTRKWLTPKESANNFREWFVKKNKPIEELSDTAVWEEIRGIIKGGMGKNFLRGGIFDVPVDAEKNISSLIHALEIDGHLERQRKNWRIRNESDFDWRGINNPEICSPGNKPCRKMERLLRCTHQGAAAHNLISQEAYLADTRSRIDNRTLREKIYQIAEEYDAWMRSTDMGDDNDLALEAIRNLLAKGIDGREAEKYKAVFLDEAQDLTELENFALQLLHRKAATMVAADRQQIIHPAYFEKGRINAGWHQMGVNAEDRQEYLLGKNWRSARELTHFHNVYRECRNSVEKMTEEERMDDESCGMMGGQVVWVRATESNINILTQKMAEYPDKLQQLTMENIHKNKGREFPIVLADQIMDRMKPSWDSLEMDRALRSKDSCARAELRYAINIFGVASTRAEKVLLIIESGEARGSDWLENAVGMEVCAKWEEIGSHELAQLQNWIDGISEDELLSMAQQAEQNELFEEAIDRYERMERFAEANRCRAKKAIQLRDYNEAVHRYLLAGMKDEVSPLLELCRHDPIWLAGKVVTEKGDAEHFFKDLKSEWTQFDSGVFGFEQLLVTYPIVLKKINEVVSSSAGKIDNQTLELSYAIERMEAKMKKLMNEMEGEE